MVVSVKLVSVWHKTQQPKWLNLLTRNTHFKSPSSEHHILQKTAAVFWDFDNKPPNPTPPFDAALNLKKTASCFGFVRHMIAYTNRHSLTSVPRQVRERRNERKTLSKLEKEGFVKPVEPYRCGVCGRNFFNHDKFGTDFKTIHERENAKRLSQIESARGALRINLVGKYSMKMEKYKRACEDGFLGPKKELESELERAGFRVEKVNDELHAVDYAMKRDIVGFMDKRRFDCLVIVPDDSDFVGVVEEAKMRCLRTVVIGNSNDEALKRVADKRVLWREVLSGKAKKEAGPVSGRWRDQDVALQSRGRDDEGVGDESKAWWEIQE